MAEERKQPLLFPDGTSSCAWSTPADSSSSTEVFCYVFVFKMPVLTSEQEEQVFQRVLKVKGKTHEDLLSSMVLHRAAKGDKRFTISCEGQLKNARNACIEMFKSLFETMFEDDPESRVFVFKSADENELFMCVKLGDRTAQKMADIADYPFQLANSDHTFDKLGIKLSNRADIVPAYVHFDAFMQEQDLLTKYKRSDTNGDFIMRRVDMIRLLYHKLTDYIDLPEMERIGLVSSFPGHNAQTLKRLRVEWASFHPKVALSLNQPIQQLRDYFGEQIAFYFLFLQFTTKALLILFVFTVPMSLVHYIAPQDGMIQQCTYMLYCIGLVMLYAVGLKLWHRTEAYYVNRWGMNRRPSRHQVHEPLNPDFEGEMKPWDLDENEETEMPIRHKYIIGRIMSAVGAILYISAITVCVGLTQYYVGTADKAGNVNAQQYGAYAVSAQIKIFSFLWDYVSPKLTHLEQHVTMNGWDQSMAMKIYSVNFFNTFFPFFYIAFVMPLIDDRNDNQHLLTYNIEICFVLYLLFGMLDVILPYINFQYKVWKQKKAVQQLRSAEEVKVSFLENQSKLDQYTGDTMTADFMQVIFPLAFVALFSAAFPLYSCVLAIINLSMQRSVDAWKLCNTYRRTFPVMVDGIGIWNQVLRRLGGWSLLVNLLLVFNRIDVHRFLAFSPQLQEVMSQSPVTLKVALFLGLMNLFFILWVTFDSYFPDVSAETELSVQQQGLQINRLFQEKTLYHEQITLWCNGDVENHRFHTIEPLRRHSLNAGLF